MADNDYAVGKLVDFVSHSRIWRRTSIFITEDDAQGSTDHVNAHRTVALVVSPWAGRRGVVHSLSSTASVTKTVDEHLGLAPSSVGDVLASDLRDYFVDRPDVTPYTVRPFADPPAPTPAAARIDRLMARLDASGPDPDPFRIARIGELGQRAERLARQHRGLSARTYRARQDRLYRAALAVVSGESPEDAGG